MASSPANSFTVVRHCSSPETRNDHNVVATLQNPERTILVYVEFLGVMPRGSRLIISLLYVPSKLSFPIDLIIKIPSQRAFIFITSLRYRFKIDSASVTQ